MARRMTPRRQRQRRQPASKAAAKRHRHQIQPRTLQASAQLQSMAAQRPGRALQRQPGPPRCARTAALVLAMPHPPPPPPPTILVWEWHAFGIHQ